MSRLLVIGGSDAGTMAALRARELDPALDVTMILADAFPNYSVCGLPFYLSGEVEQLDALAHRRASDLAAAGVEVLIEHTATDLSPETKKVQVRTPSGATRTLRYDRVVIATGARARVGALGAAEHASLHTIGDGIWLRERIDARPEHVAIVGAGYIGMEMADAFTRRGLRVTLLSRPATVLPTLDAPLGERLRAELERNGVVVLTGVPVSASDGAGVTTADGRTIRADLVLVAGGVEPNVELARAAGVATATRGAIEVDRQMRTNVPDVLAAGDCVETWHALLERPAYLPLGTTAHKQGRIAGETATGGTRKFRGSLGTQVVKVFDLAAARTGLNDRDAREAGFDPLTVEATPWDHKAYYPGAERLHIRISGDTRTRRLLGAQMVGHWRAEVAKRIDVIAAALHAGATVDELNDYDLSYTPPLGAPWDALQEAAQAWARAAP